MRMIVNEKESKLNGFTLIEILLAISLVIILVGVLFSVINPVGIQKKGRDSQRLSDLAKIKVALEVYFSDNRRYPVRTSWVQVNSLNELVPNYIRVIPTDPKSAGVPCNNDGWYDYFYKSDANGSQYVLAAKLEVEPSTTCPISAICNTLCNSRDGNVYYTTSD